MLVIHQLISQVIFVAGVAGQLPHPLVLGSGWSLMGLFLAISLICYDERARNGIRAPTLFAPTWFAPLSVATFLVGSLSLHLLVIGLTCRIWLAAFVGCVLMFVAVALIRAVAANRNV
jgi:hypothetical protein